MFQFSKDQSDEAWRGKEPCDPKHSHLSPTATVMAVSQKNSLPVSVVLNIKVLSHNIQV